MSPAPIPDLPESAEPAAACQAEAKSWIRGDLPTPECPEADPHSSAAVRAPIHPGWMPPRAAAPGSP